jgi:ribosomal protein S18 acetylase RimI-like enzyme
MICRLYKPDDFAALYAIEEICFQPLFRFDRAFMRQLAEGHNSATWIAEAEGKMAGFAIVEWSVRSGKLRAYIQTIEVLPENRGRGTGGQLLACVESSAQEAGAEAIWLHVDESNASAIRLYEAHGFIGAGKRDQYYPLGRGALIYRKPLARKPLK